MFTVAEGPDSKTSLYASASELAYHQAVHRANLQRTGLDELRTRASTVLLVSALVATFFVGQAAENGLSTLGWAALIVFAGIVLVSVGIVFPTKGWTFSLPPKDMVRIAREQGQGASDAEFRAGAAQSLEVYGDCNGKRMERLYWLFRAECCLLGIDVVLWTLDLATT